MKRKLTPEQLVKARYPHAGCQLSVMYCCRIMDYSNQRTPTILSGSARSEIAAWANAARRLAGEKGVMTHTFGKRQQNAYDIWLARSQKANEALSRAGSVSPSLYAVVQRALKLAFKAGAGKYGEKP